MKAVIAKDILQMNADFGVKGMMGVALGITGFFHVKVA